MSRSSKPKDEGLNLESISYSPENAEAFFEQIEKWNDEDEYSLCIKALEDVPPALRTYRLSYALARALENYAVIGDHGEGTPRGRSDEALHRAIEVLESVEEEGKDKAEWNMRMAYGYQYLFEQEEKALPYARRWAELDPEDKDAEIVVKECLEEIENRRRRESGTAAGEEPKKAGVFTGFVLLSKGTWDRAQFIRDMKEMWDVSVKVDDEDEDRDALVFEVGQAFAAVSLMPFPIPGGEAELNAENNYMWPEAIDAAKAHCAHIMAAVLGEGGLLEKGRLFTQILAACCRQTYASGVYTSGVVFEPKFYEGFADMMKSGSLPIHNWIWFGLYRNEAGVNGYTYGMTSFGKEEMEVLGADAEPEAVRDFLASLAMYVLQNDVVLHDGETVGFTEADKRSVSRGPGESLPKEQTTLKISWRPNVPKDAENSAESRDDDLGGDGFKPEVYSIDEMEAVEEHIEKHFGSFETVMHEMPAPDLHVDVCIIPPAKDRDYYSLVTMGMGAHRMNVPSELAEYKLERAELAIALPPCWKLDPESFQDEKWYWPVRLLKGLARYPAMYDTWLGFGHTISDEEPYAKDTKLCASILIGLQNTDDDADVCTLPNGDEVNFYQVIPLYKEELDYKLEHDSDALMDKMRGISFIVNPERQNALLRGTLADVDPGNFVMDDAAWHLESIHEKNLKVDEASAFSHMAIYLRWSIENGLMSEEFLKKHRLSEKTDLRAFIRDELDGRLSSGIFNKTGRAFAAYYYGDNESPSFPRDIDDYCIGLVGQEKNYSDEIQDEAYLFIPFDEEYQQAMMKLADERLKNWKGQEYDEDTLRPSELAEAMMEYLDCECTYFPSMRDDDPISSAYGYARRDSSHEGFIPVIIKPDEALLECLVMNSDPENSSDCLEFDIEAVREFRRKTLSEPAADARGVFAELIEQRRREAADDEMDWEEDIVGKVEGGFENDRFSIFWNPETHMTYPLILAKIPVENPWEVFAYLPFGGFNECPDTSELVSTAKYWFEKHGAAPAVFSHDELEFVLPKPVSEDQAFDAALEQYGFCPDVLDNVPEEATLGALEDLLRRSTVWYFWWD